MDRRDFLKYSTGTIFGLMAAGALCPAGRADEPSASDAPKRKVAAWKPLFDGKTLAGWKPDGKAVWTVENGCIVGVQGPGDMQMRSGWSAAISSRVISSLRLTSISAPSSPKYCTRL